MSSEFVHRYYSNGKLLITGEYIVLHGAVSLAVPTESGQLLSVNAGADAEMLEWKTSVLSDSWFHCKINPVSMEILETDKEDIALNLLRILKAASELKGDSDWMRNVRVISEIGFAIEWGLGSSSSLISNIAWWAGIDPFQLAGRISQGSGYDIACARSDLPLLYKIESGPPQIEPVNFHPPFADRLAFVYLGQKQESSSSVKNFLNHAHVREKDIIRISEISRQLVLSEDLNEYEQMLNEHEEILSGILDKPPVKEVLFRDYPGIVKSLGAWGGDFVHISLGQDIEGARKYFAAKGLNVLIPYKEMIKKTRDEK